MRWLFGASGLVVGLYGGYLLLSLGMTNLVQAVLWLAGAVIVHDGLIGPSRVLRS